MSRPTFARAAVLLGSFMLAVAPAGGQPGGNDSALGEGPWEYSTYEAGGTRVRVSVVARGLVQPWSLAWLPGGDMLITERGGSFRLVRDGRLLPAPLPGLPDLNIDQLFDVALHPDFADNRLIYFTYMKTGQRPDGGSGYWATTALARARLERDRLFDVEDVFLADGWRPLRGGDASRILFAEDGTLFMSSSHRREPDGPQQPENHVGAIVRLNDDGSAPADNPFVGRNGYRPEVFSFGHRTVLGLTFHPDTGALWEVEQGPQGGDEVNIIEAGGNYGWPLVTYGIDYDGSPAARTPWREEFVPPKLFWVPSIAASGMTFYTGDRIPAWRGNLFVGAMTVGRLPRTGRLERIVFADNGGELRRESMFGDLRQRIRDVRQGPDGLLYLLTAENDGAVLVVEPVD